ncbi:MAG: DNA replication/repair protein RecF [Cyclobacteriaceae bacterium]|jgi:DNA replication and repair protein RecF|nr:DNA replication/repair protein RecF [Cyclobacteriaceae bacterium]
MILQKISLTNFKNYESIEIDFSKGLNCFTGLNGSGKTNLLDAIHYLSLTKSAFNSIDSQNIRHNTSFFALRAEFEEKNKNYKLVCSLKIGEKKNLKIDDSPYNKLSEHIGRFPVVLIAPNDDDLIRESSETRRKFVDSIISQADKKYLTDLISYTHYLKQRNSLLKRINETGKRDLDLLNQYDGQIVTIGLRIAIIRQKFIDTILPEFTSQYKFLCDEKEHVDITYQTMVLDESFSQKLKACLEKDIVLQRTSMGVHRDDYSFLINDTPLRKFGSQGQQKSFLIGLKLSQFDYIKQKKGITPILLLDDIFDKLDDERIQKLLQMIEAKRFEQIFITDARRERTESILQKLNTEIRVFNIHENEIS